MRVNRPIFRRSLLAKNSSKSRRLNLNGLQLAALRCGNVASRCWRFLRGSLFNLTCTHRCDPRFHPGKSRLRKVRSLKSDGLEQAEPRMLGQPPAWRHSPQFWAYFLPTLPHSILALATGCCYCMGSGPVSWKEFSCWTRVKLHNREIAYPS